MPKAAIDKDRDTSANKDKIGASPYFYPGERPVDAKAKAEPMESGAKTQFGWCVAATSGHHARPNALGRRRRATRSVSASLVAPWGDCSFRRRS